MDMWLGSAGSVFTEKSAYVRIRIIYTYEDATETATEIRWLDPPSCFTWVNNGN